MSTISSRELVEWHLYDELEPLEARADLRAGTITAMIAEVNRDPQKRKDPYTPADFFPSLVSDSEPVSPPVHNQDAERQASALRNLAAALPGLIRVGTP